MRLLPLCLRRPSLRGGRQSFLFVERFILAPFELVLAFITGRGRLSRPKPSQSRGFLWSLVCSAAASWRLRSLLTFRASLFVWALGRRQQARSSRRKLCSLPSPLPPAGPGGRSSVSDTCAGLWQVRPGSSTSPLFGSGRPCAEGGDVRSDPAVCTLRRGEGLLLRSSLGPRVLGHLPDTMSSSSVSEEPQGVLSSLLLRRYGLSLRSRATRRPASFFVVSFFRLRHGRG